MRSSWVVLISAVCSVGAAFAGCGDDVETPTGATTGDGPLWTPYPTSGGGAGGGMACGDAGTCPGADTECQKRTCEDGVCGLARMPAGTLGSSQIEGDCKRNECDAEGMLRSVEDDADVQDDGKSCTVDACAAGAPTHAPRPMGTACSELPGKVCDGAGKCVQCLTDADCQGGLCDMNACVPASCTDGMVNGDETDEDCGGSCNPCIPGKMCLVADDCDALVCAGGVCSPPGCSDMVKNGSETDDDCGGAGCAPCVNGKTCAVAADCVSGVCGGNPPACLSAGCGDMVLNGSETGVDCGGAVCAPCAVGLACNVAADCQSKLCLSGVCAQINGCDLTNAVDMTAAASVTISFGGALGLKYEPKCIRVKAGTMVTFNGSFLSHPLHAGLVDEDSVPTPAAPGTSPLPTGPTGQDSGSSATFTMSPPGMYGYYCGYHLTFAMNGAIFVE